MKKNIEIEIRGPLSKNEYTEIKAFFDINAEKVEVKDRILIDYSRTTQGDMSERKKDIRLRVTNGVPEIIIKLGSWGEHEQRKELSVTTPPGTFDALTEIFAALGYEKGVLCIRKSHVYIFKNIEFALVEVPQHSYFYEAEKMADENEDAEKLMNEMKAICAELGLKVFDKNGFFSYVEKLNKEANEQFDILAVKENYFKERFGLSS